MRYALQYADPELNGAMTFTVRLVDPDSKRPYRDGRFDLLDEDATLAFCRECAADLAGGGDGTPADAHVDELMAQLTKKVAEVYRTTPGHRRRPGVPRRFRPFPTHLLPKRIARYVREAAASLGCDESFVALPVLVLLGSAIGTTRRILLKRTWREYPIVWCVIVAVSGSKKSPPFDLALAPLQKLQREAYRRWEEELKQYQAALQVYERDLSLFKKGKGGDEPPAKPEAPVLEHLIVSDTTVEALAPILRSRRRGVTLYRDELSGWLGGMNQYKSRGGADSAHWLEMHGGRSLKVDRKSGMPLLVPHAAVWVTGSIQPATLRRCLGDEHFENGMAARPLYAYPPRRQSRWSDRELDAVTEAGLQEVVRRLMSLTFNVTPDGDEVPIDTPLSADGRAAWVRFVDEHGEEQFKLGEGSLAAAFSKLEGYAARLALIVHFARWSSSDPYLKNPDEVDADSVRAGIELSRWFGGEAERLYGAMRETDEEAEQRELVELLRHLGGRATPRDLVHHSRKYRSTADANAALLTLVDAGVARVLHPKPSAKGGRPSKVYELIEPDGQDEPEGVNSVNETKTPGTGTPAGVSLKEAPPAPGVSSTDDRDASREADGARGVNETNGPRTSEPASKAPSVDETPTDAAGSGVSVSSTPHAPPHRHSPVVEVDV